MNHTNSTKKTYLINVFHSSIFTLDDPLAAVFPLAANFADKAVTLRFLAGSDLVGFGCEKPDAETDFAPRLRFSNSGRIFASTPPEGIVTCFSSCASNVKFNQQEYRQDLQFVQCE